MSDLIYLRGTPKELRPVVISLMATYQLMQNLDVGSGENINDNFDLDRKYHPTIKLYFVEDTTFIPGSDQPKGQGQNRKRGQLSFRLMRETTETLTKGNLIVLGQKIKDSFGNDKGYVWSKGKQMYCYADWARGYQMQMLCRGEGQARDLVSKILSLQNDSPIWKYLTKNSNVEQGIRYPETEEKRVILGEQTTIPIRRPNVDVRFTYAKARVNPLVRPIVIYDRTGKQAGALVR